MLISLRNRKGEVAARVLAVPFLRPVDLPVVQGGDADPLIEGVRALYADAFSNAAEQMGAGEALIATGHCYMTGTRISELSERKILGGNQHALPVDIFANDRLAYAALGHLHLAQSVGGHGHIRYAGSPIPLSLSEATYAHQVTIAEFDGPRFARAERVLVPRSVAMIRVPDGDGALPPKEAIEACRSLPERSADLAESARPYLEVHVAVERPEPSLRRDLEAALAGRAARLLKLTQHRGGTGASLAESVPERSLADLTPEDVLRRKWRSEHEGEIPVSMIEAFHELVDAARQEVSRQEAGRQEA